jgi:hypothetical protein
MKNILVLADGKTAQRFLERLINSDTSSNRYCIVFYTDSIVPVNSESEKFKYYKFDPTSLVKLKALVERYDFFQCMMILSKHGDFKQSYKNLREIDPKMQIVTVDRWSTEFNDPNITTIDLHDTVSNIFSNYLPDFPLFAQNLGLGTGEIMELKVPSGSSYSYRHLRNINQKRWKIAAIFREHKLILPLPSTVLLPNDSILIVGNPNVLKGIYKSIKRESGQFPIPYGENIYCYIDMKYMSDEEIEMMINDSLILHSKLNNQKLIFKIVNSRLTHIVEKIKSYSNKSLIVEFEYEKSINKEIIQNDINRYFIGLIITTPKYLNMNLSIFHRFKIPILKIGINGFMSVKSGILLSSDSSRVQKTSSTIFDLSSQLDIDISLYDEDFSDSLEHKKVVSDFKSLAKIFNKKINIIESDGNPILKLKNRDDFLQFIIFEKKLLSLKILSYFSTDVERHYFRFENIYQIFLPSDT